MIDTKALFIAIVLLLSTYASAQYEAELSSALVKQEFVLRNYYTDQHLEYDSDGKLVSNSRHGFGPTDGLIYVQQVQLKPDKLILKGHRSVPVFDKTTGAYQLLDVDNRVTVEVSLPPNQPASQSVPSLLNLIFMKQSELDKMKCSSQEEQEFRQNILSSLAHKKGFDKAESPPVTTLDQLHPYCFPNGERAYRVGRGIKPQRLSPPVIPIILKLPDGPRRKVPLCCC